MFGCYRKSEANDPDTYVAAIAAVLAEYPADVVQSVTDPRRGLPRTLKWPPTIAEVAEKCDWWMSVGNADQRAKLRARAEEWRAQRMGK